MFYLIKFNTVAFTLLDVALFFLVIMAIIIYIHCKKNIKAFTGVTKLFLFLSIITLLLSGVFFLFFNTQTVTTNGGTLYGSASNSSSNSRPKTIDKANSDGKKAIKNSGKQSSNDSKSLSKDKQPIPSGAGSSKPAQTKPNNSAFVQKIVGEWQWYTNSPDGLRGYTIRFNSNGTCNFQHSIKVTDSASFEPMSKWRFTTEEYSGTYQILDSNTISFKGVYKNYGKPEDFPNRIKNCATKFKIEWVTKDNQGDSIFATYPDAHKGMKLSLIDGTSPLPNGQDSDIDDTPAKSPYFVG